MCGHNHPTMRNELGQRHVLGSSWRCNRRRGGQVFCCRVFSYSCNPWIHKVLKSSLRLSAFAEIGKCFHIHHIKIRLIDLRLGFIYLCFVFIWTSILIGRGRGSGDFHITPMRPLQFDGLEWTNRSINFVSNQSVGINFGP
jgi:hypothetical protein